MPIIVTLLLIASPQPPAALSDAALTRPVWVFFTDKGANIAHSFQTALLRAEQTAPALQKERRAASRVGYDYHDLPVPDAYIREIERLGARTRVVSRWLNGASFDVSQDILFAVQALPFVIETKPVGIRTEREPSERIPLSRSGTLRAQAVDSAAAHRFYGPSFDQARMMGVPELFFKGYFGSGVRLAIFDTGLKLKNVGVKGMRIVAQHDFLSGDHFHTAAPSGWNPRSADRLRYLGLVRDPALTRAGSRATLMFVADSFSYGYSAPRRALFASRSTDAGGSWSDPLPLVLSDRATQFSSHTFENVRVAVKDSFTCVAYNDLASSYRARPQVGVFLGYFDDDVWRGVNRVATGRWPDIALVRDSLLLCLTENDSTVLFRKGPLGAIPPQWTVTTQVRTGSRLTDLRLGADTLGQVVILGVDHHAGTVAQFRSTDRGLSFARSSQPLIEADDIELARTDSGLVLIAREQVHPFTRLGVLFSADLGATWQTRSPAADSMLAIGGFTSGVDQSGLNVIYDAGGYLYRTNSTDNGASWQTAALVDSSGFCTRVALTSDGSDLLAAWVKRGDGNTDREDSDTARFSRDQPDHGTRMASIICGYQQGSLIGIAPGVDLMVAKTEFHKTAGGRYYEFDLEEDTYIEALEWAESRGADIVSTSLGYRGWYTDDQLDGKTAPISRAAGIAVEKGLVVVTAMGNRDTTNYPWPNPYLTAPADAFGVISAGGVQRSLLPWRGTGAGPTADGRIKPELVALSDTVAVVAPDSTSGLEGSVGTSCATALIAGACALIKEAHPTWSADSIKAALFSTATRSVPNCTFGYGVPRVDSAFKVFPPAQNVNPTPRDELVAFPNPFSAGQSPKVYFAVNLTRPSPRALISIYTASGTLVDTIRLKPDPISRPGRYSDIPTLERVGSFWSGLNASGRPVGSGLYLAVLRTTYGSAASRFTLVR